MLRLLKMLNEFLDDVDFPHPRGEDQIFLEHLREYLEGLESTEALRRRPAENYP